MPQEDNKYAATAWGNEGGVGNYHDLEVPSGQLCLVKRPGVQVLMKMGLLNDLDSLTSFVNSDMIPRAEGQKIKQEEAMDLLNDPKKFERVMYVVDRIVAECVIKPEVRNEPNDPTNRTDGVVYTDMIDINDKMFIFQYVLGGTNSVERFRKESGEFVGSVQAKQGDEDSSQ